MPLWQPAREWEGEDCYIIGGGPSLRNFDWSLLAGHRVIGCNSAYTLGEDICQICIFGDRNFWTRFSTRLAEFKGRVVSVLPSLLHNSQTPWLLTMKRFPDGLIKKGGLGWNKSTGAAAVNLALQMGAKRVFLLGYDMGASEGRFNWHDEDKGIRKQASVYDRFIRAFATVARDLPKVFPGCQVINVTNGSRLPHFPKESVEEHFNLCVSEEVSRGAAGN